MLIAFGNEHLKKIRERENTSNTFKEENFRRFLYSREITLKGVLQDGETCLQEGGMYEVKPDTVVRSIHNILCSIQNSVV